MAGSIDSQLSSERLDLPAGRAGEACALALVSAAAALALASAVLEPWLETALTPAAVLVRLAWSPVCHQIPERCLDLGHGPLAICARCTGLYLGGVLGLVAAAVYAACGRAVPRPSWRWLALAAAPSLVDVAAGRLGLGGLSSWPRLMIGVAPGLVCGLALGHAVADLVRTRTRSRPCDQVPPLSDLR